MIKTKQEQNKISMIYRKKNHRTTGNREATFLSLAYSVKHVFDNGYNVDYEFNVFICL